MRSRGPPPEESRCGTARSWAIRPLDLPGKTALPKRPASTTEPTHLDLKDIKAIIDLMKKNDLSVFEMEKDGFRLKLQKGPGDQPVVAAPLTLAPTATTPQAPSGAEAAGTETGGLKDIVSPMVGTFYRGASPDAAPFVDVGKNVSEDTVVCIIEAMKVMNE